MIYYDNLDKIKHQQNMGFVKCFVAQEKHSEQIEQLANYFEKSTEIKYKIIKKYELNFLAVQNNDYCFAIVAGLQYIENHNLNNIYLINAKGEVQNDSILDSNKSLNEKIKDKIKHCEENPFLEN